MSKNFIKFVLSHNMQISIDYREKKLIDLLDEIHKTSDSKESQKISLEISNLQLGDIILSMNENDIVIERKSVSDLLSSITDGRYKEQSYRLQNSSHHNHNYILIEEVLIIKSIYAI